jgi:hypothetical protein
MLLASEVTPPVVVQGNKVGRKIYRGVNLSAQQNIDLIQVRNVKGC